jgi:tetrahydromethanopterin S-methyltransferase subunit A
MLMLSDEAVKDLTIEETKQNVTDVEEDSAKEKQVDSEDLTVAAQEEILYDNEQSFVVPMAKDTTRTRWRARKKTITLEYQSFWACLRAG